MGAEHVINLVWTNNISDEPEAEGSRDYYRCSCAWKSPILSEGGEEAMRRHVIETCPTCQRIKQEGGYGPPHFASERCESGRRDHCSCDTCF